MAKALTESSARASGPRPRIPRSPLLGAHLSVARVGAGAGGRGLAQLRLRSDLRQESAAVAGVAVAERTDRAFPRGARCYECGTCYCARKLLPEPGLAGRSRAAGQHPRPYRRTRTLRGPGRHGAGVASGGASRRGRRSKIKDRKQSRDRQGADRRLSNVDCRLSNERTRDSKGIGEVNAMAAGIERIARSVDDVRRRCAGFGTMILLETTARKGTSIGWRFEHLRGILDRVSGVRDGRTCTGVREQRL